MRGPDERQAILFSYRSIEDRIPGEHPLRALRRLVTPHVSPNRHRHRRRSSVDARTTRHPGFTVSQRKRKLVEEGFGWHKTVGLLRRLQHRGRAKVGWIFAFTSAAYNLVRLRTLLAMTPP
jgi:hypothetical protein